MATLIKNENNTFSYGCTQFTIANVSEPVLYNVLETASSNPRGEAALELWYADVAMEVENANRAAFGIAGGFMYTINSNAPKQN